MEIEFRNSEENLTEDDVHINPRQMKIIKMKSLFIWYFI